MTNFDMQKRDRCDNDTIKINKKSNRKKSNKHKNSCW